jgi:hypothetical protein
MELDDIVPPPDVAHHQRRLVMCGLVPAIVAAILGVGLDMNSTGGPGPLATLRLVLVAFSALATLHAVSQVATRPLLWGLAAIAAVAWRFGLPEHWDSARLLASVAAAVCVAGGVLAAVPLQVRCALISAAVVFHFGAIFTATTRPTPTPWLVDQVATRVTLPYLSFTYLTNAYHFYSPEPGPASLLYCLVTYDEIDPETKKPVAEWITLPNRAEQPKDPLELTYYRRLSLTEQVAMTVPDYVTPSAFEKLDIRVRRYEVALGKDPKYPRIPLAPDEIEQPIYQYRMPYPGIMRYVVPSYARHILKANSTNGRVAKTVKLYRLEHRIVPVNVYREKLSPYHPITYRPYFLGEFRLDDTDEAVMVNPQDPMLYWLVPILPKRLTNLKAEDVDDQIEDYLSKHAGYKVDWRRP